MNDKIEDINRELFKLASSKLVQEFKILEKSKSVIKARLYLSDELFIQFYINIKKPKKSFSLVLSDFRIFGKDYLFNNWHIHPYNNPEFHDNSENAGKRISMEEFFEDAVEIAINKLNIL